MTTGEDAAPTGSAAVDDAIARMRAVAAEQGASGPGTAGTADADVLRTALATLPHTEQRLLWDSHVLGRSLDSVAGALGLHLRSARRRLARAEEQLARALSAAHARGVPQRLCVETRGNLHAYVSHRLGGGRRQALEDHLYGCAGCLRAFVDVRQASWALRDAAPVLLGPLAASGVAAPVVVGAIGAGTSTGLAGWFAGLGAALVGAWEWLGRGLRNLVGRPVGLAAGAAGALVAVAAVAMSLAAGGGPEAVPAAVGSSPTPAVAAPPAASPGASSTPSVSPSAAATPDQSPLPAASEPAATPTSVPTPDVADQGDGAGEPGPDSADARAGDGDDQPSRVGDGDAGREPTPSATTTPGGSGTTSPTARPTVAPPVVPDPVVPTPGPVTPGPSAEPEPEPEPSVPEPTVPEPAEPVTVEVTLRVGGVGWYRVVPTGGAEIVAVVGGHRTEVTQDRQGVWWARAIGVRDREVTVVVTGPAGSEPGARLSWFGLEP